MAGLYWPMVKWSRVHNTRYDKLKSKQFDEQKKRLMIEKNVV